MSAARIVPALACLSLLTACVGLETPKPLLTHADEAGAPRLRTGVWAVNVKPGPCSFDEHKPIDQWRGCAAGVVIGPDTLRMQTDNKPKVVWETLAFIFSAGDPRIGQVGGKDKDGTEAYDYAVAGATTSDAEGRIVSVTLWTVLCGPPAPDGADQSKLAAGTLALLPGLTTQPDSSHCSTTSVDALRGAAKASLAWKDSPIVAHWVRDGDR